MKIAVCIKHVPDGRLRIDSHTRRLDRGGPGDLNSVDRYALEEALRLRDSGASEEVVVLSMGPESAADSVRTALGLGADRGVLVSDPALAGSDLLSTANVLAKMMEGESPGLVFFGQQTADGGGAVLGAAVAELLRMPFVSQVSSVTLEGSMLRVGRQTEGGDEVIEVQTPAIVSVSDSINEPRYPSLKGMMAAKRKPLVTRSVADLGVDADQFGVSGATTVVIAVGPPPVRGGGRRIDDDANAPERIVEFLVEMGLL
jgi:electron transfer flavoprotein beta subunit